MSPGASGGMRLLSAVTVGELTRRAHVRVTADTPLGTVVDEMTAKKRGCVLVEDDGALVGIFTERDLYSRVDHAGIGWSAQAVREVMTPRPVVSQPGDSLADALRQMIAGRRRHLPVVDDAGRVLGLLSVRDILAFVAQRFPEELMNLPPDPGHET